MRYEQVDKLGEFDVFGRLIVAEDLFAQIAVCVDKEALCGIPSRRRDVILRAAPVAGVVVGESHAVGYAQV